MSDRLHICQTCERDAPSDASGLSRGQRLTDRIVEALNKTEVAQQFAIRKVPCLSGCVNPCNVSFRATGKVSLRFGGLDESLVDDVVAFACLYHDSQDGDVDQGRWPPALREKMTARTPVPGGS